jgi:hypothetical protein
LQTAGLAGNSLAVCKTAVCKTCGTKGETGADATVKERKKRYGTKGAGRLKLERLKWETWN